jgi:hypothetical protein
MWSCMAQAWPVPLHTPCLCLKLAVSSAGWRCVHCLLPHWSCSTASSRQLMVVGWRRRAMACSRSSPRTRHRSCLQPCPGPALQACSTPSLARMEGAAQMRWLRGSRWDVDCHGWAGFSCPDGSVNTCMYGRRQGTRTANLLWRFTPTQRSPEKMMRLVRQHLVDVHERWLQSVTSCTV